MIGLLVALLGLVALGAGIYFIVKAALVVGIILVVVGLLILGGGIHNGYYGGARRPL